MHLPAPLPERLAQRGRVLAELARVLPPDAIVAREEDLTVYESDGLSAYRSRPMVVVLPARRRRWRPR